MFKKYNSIENTYREKAIEQVYLHDYGNDVFVVQEKVHGANFSFITEGNTIKVAKRTSLISEDENFNNYKYVVNTYEKAVLELFKLVKVDFPETEMITVYGELFGGSYPHPDVETPKEMTRIQKGVFYSPENDFYAFDICINHKQYVDVTIANTYFEKVGLFYAKTLFAGTFSECMAYPNAFESKVHEWLNLPTIEDNVCEGTVIKPLVSSRFGNGQRVIFKNKNEKWSEKSHIKRKDVQKQSVTEVLSATEKELMNTLLGYVNENRLMNVQSKLGEFSPKQTGKTIGLLAKDALEDFVMDYETAWKNTEKQHQKVMTKILNREAATVVKEVLLFK
ncbi:RNA ligase, Rnl2 family [Kordia sp. YSTF-M3]|uniref:RNA ligase (ATP) n=1 Tax=Kordia aestuariivivens TaxID=2759037 RepID=A0ABR7QA46_9FLAO|nr:RNA ligase, Rnl2 family [Kordia aestuariivivens]MBC8755442.1 RNA ligase, Rnl2 family [Kordia aestuariivivens]